MHNTFELRKKIRKTWRWKENSWKHNIGLNSCKWTSIVWHDLCTFLKQQRIVLNIIINLFICIKAFKTSGKANLQFQEQFQCYYIWSARGIKLQGGIVRRGVWGRMDTSIYTAESLCCSSETITLFSVNWLYPNLK